MNVGLRCTGLPRQPPPFCRLPTNQLPLSNTCATFQGIVQHEFLALRRRLEADFAFFSACASGASLSTHAAPTAAPAGRKGLSGAAAAGTAAAAARRRAFKRLSSIEAHERRFLRDFMQCMHASHFRLLGRDEWEAAAAEVGHALPGGCLFKPVHAHRDCACPPCAAAPAFLELLQASA